MAKRSNEPISGADKAKVRVFFAELEGNNESVQEALKTMVSAMSRPVRVISDQRVDGKAHVLLEKADIEEVEGPIEQLSEVETSGDDTTPQSARKPRGTGRRIDRNAGLELVPNLNFRPGGKPALQDFVEEKDPNNDLKMMLVMVYYMQHVMELAKMGPAHVMTAFKEAKKPYPADIRQTIRNVRNSRMWLNFADIEDIRTTTQGDNFVEHEMGKSE
jgi:hypothetical protein